MNKGIPRVLISRSSILSRVEELARQISSDYEDKDPILIGVLNGVIFFFAELVLRLNIPCRIDFVKASSYGSGCSSSGSVRLLKDIQLPLEGKNVILIEDIVDTGLTLKEIVKMVKERNPASVKICALIDKRERRTEEISVDYWGFHVKEGFLVGYGLDFDEQYRYLPDICVLE
jgi:hypoxanthine phosphoribosyltransferase